MKCIWAWEWIWRWNRWSRYMFQLRGCFATKGRRLVVNCHNALCRCQVSRFSLFVLSTSRIQKHTRCLNIYGSRYLKFLSSFGSDTNDLAHSHNFSALFLSEGSIGVMVWIISRTSIMVWNDTSVIFTCTNRWESLILILVSESIVSLYSPQDGATHGRPRTRIKQTRKPWTSWIKHRSRGSFWQLKWLPTRQIALWAEQGTCRLSFEQKPNLR